MNGLFDRLIGDERGATAIEYGLIVSLIVIAIMVSLTAMADNITGVWTNVAGEIVR